MTADEIIVETALGGLRYCLASFSQTINLATTGAGAMDTGTAPASGYVALYAIYNPTTQTAKLLATNATSTAVPSVYGAGNMPSGYTASALVSVWATNASSQFKIGYQRDRHIDIAPTQFLSTGTAAASPTSVSIAGTVPPNAVAFYANGTCSYSGGTSVSVSSYLCATTGGVGIGTVNGSNSPAVSSGATSTRNSLAVAQTTYYFLSTVGSPTSVTVTYSINGYDF
jgi:hypothetical protein